MEASKELKISRPRFKTFVMLAAAAALTSCAHTRARSGENPLPTTVTGTSTQPRSAETFGPPLSDAAQAPYGPEPARVRPIVLVFGPGMARTFADAGALRALAHAKIPISAVVGVEMGALVGGLYAIDGNINHFEWALLKYKNEFFSKQKGLFSDLLSGSRASGDAEKLDAQLKRSFARRDLIDLRTSFHLVVEARANRAPILLDRGGAAEAVRAALAVPGVFPPAPWEGVEAVAAEDAESFAVTEAKSLGRGPVVVIDTQESSDSAAFKDADLVIRPDLKGISAGDFEKRTDIAFRGKSACEAQMAEIRRLAGVAP